MIKTLTPISNQVLLKNISWETYQTLLKDLEIQPGTRMNYKAGLLEIVTPLNPHESYKQLVGRFVETLTEELNLEIRSLGSSTWCREDLAAGLAPDNCYYIQNEELVRYLQQIDLTQNPPPDLAIEIDITSSSLNRLEIYAALGVPEVWRYDGNEFKIYCLEGGKYQRSNLVGIRRLIMYN